MPWSSISPMDRKTQFIADYIRHALSLTELCACAMTSFAKPLTNGLHAINKNARADCSK
jgi:hypothetical protein